MTKTSIHDVAKYFIALSEPGTSKSVTPLKLQKLVYYAQALSYPFNNRKMFDEDFEAWVHGPVSPELYTTYKDFRWNEINISIPFPVIDEDDETVIKAVWQLYGEKDGKILENKTHNEIPWKETREGLTVLQNSNKIIDKNKIENYCRKKFQVIRET